MGQNAELGCNKLQADAHKVERRIWGHEIEEWPNHVGDWGKEPMAEINVMPKDHLHDIRDELLNDIWTHFDPAASNKFSNFSSQSQLNFVSCDASQFQKEYSCGYIYYRHEILPHLSSLL